MASEEGDLCVAVGLYKLLLELSNVFHMLAVSCPTIW